MERVVLRSKRRGRPAVVHRPIHGLVLVIHVFLPASIRSPTRGARLRGRGGRRRCVLGSQLPLELEDGVRGRRGREAAEVVQVVLGVVARRAHLTAGQRGSIPVGRIGCAGWLTGSNGRHWLTREVIGVGRLNVVASRGR